MSLPTKGCRPDMVQLTMVPLALGRNVNSTRFNAFIGLSMCNFMTMFDVGFDSVISTPARLQ